MCAMAFTISSSKYSINQYVHGPFNKFPDFFVLAFKIVVDSWKFTMLCLETYLMILISNILQMLPFLLLGSLLFLVKCILL